MKHRSNLFSSNIASMRIQGRCSDTKHKQLHRRTLFVNCVNYPRILFLFERDKRFCICQTWTSVQTRATTVTTNCSSALTLRAASCVRNARRRLGAALLATSTTMAAALVKVGLVVSSSLHETHNIVFN